MTALRVAVLVVVCSGLSAVVMANQASSPATSDPQAVALTQKSLAALTNGVQVTDVTLTGSVRRIAGSDDETGSATLDATSEGDSRVELSFASGERVEIRNHAAVPLVGAMPGQVPPAIAQLPQSAGAWIGPDGTHHAIVGHNLMTDPTWFFPALTLARVLSSQNYILSDLGTVTFNEVSSLSNKSAICISVFRQIPQVEPSPSSGAEPTPVQFQKMVEHLSRMNFYFDPTSLRLIALTFDSHPDNNAALNIANEIVFSDYQSMSGMLVPLRVRKYLNGSLVLDLQLDNMSVNSGLPASTFALR